MKIPEKIEERLKITYEGQAIASVKLQPLVKPCDYCDKIIDKQQFIRTRLVKHPVPHARTSCSVCNLIKSPESGQFELTQAQIDQFYKENIKKR